MLANEDWAWVAGWGKDWQDLVLCTIWCIFRSHVV